MECRGIRGAIDVKTNDEETIVAATRRLLERIVEANGVRSDEVVCAFFTSTPDLDAAYPARAAREMGWAHIPLMCTQEAVTRDSIPRCIRVLILWNTDRGLDELQHVYLDGAKSLRPDLSEGKSYET